MHSELPTQWYGFILDSMRTVVSSKGRIVLPAKLREKDRVEHGQQFEVKRLRAGEYLLTRVRNSERPGLLAWLRACPEKDWFQPIASESTTVIRS